MKKITIYLLFTIICGITQAQALIVLQDGENVFAHSRLDTIIAHATPGSSIYLPGGNTLLSSELKIDKEVHIYGAGHYPDSSAATCVSHISGGNIRFVEGSDRSSITGFYFVNELYFGSSNEDTIQFIDISRCNLNTLNLGQINSTRNTPNSNIRITENIIRGTVSGADAQHCVFEKNIFDQSLQFFNGNCTFNHNVFNYYHYAYATYRYCTGLIIKNNYFRDDHGITGSQIYNNLFGVSQNDEPGGTNIGSGNIGSLSPENTFINVSEGAFSYSYDYHLKEDSPGKLAATDKTDIGIYGTETPCKASVVPVNPHIRYINIANESKNGLLHVEIHAAAQDH